MQYTTQKPYEMVTKNANFFFEIFNFCEIFRVIFEKVVFLKNGHGRHQMGAMPTYFVLVVHEIQ